MKKIIISAAVLLAVSAQAMAGTTPGAAAACLREGVEMWADGNYAGCYDCMSRVAALSPTEEITEESRYYLAMASLRLNDGDALTMLSEFLDDYPLTVHSGQVLAAMGDYYYARGSYAQAYNAYDRTTEKSLDVPTAQGVKFRTSYCLLMLGEPSRAKEGFESLSSSGEYGADARFYTAYISYLDGNYGAAKAIFEQGGFSDSLQGEADYYLMQIAFREGDFSRSLPMAQRLLSSGKITEFLPECNRIAGESLYNLGREAEAAPYLWKYCAEAVTPEPGAFYILGVSELRDGNVDNAIKLLQKAIGHHSAMGQSAYLMLGQAYVARGDNSQALMAFENAYRVDYDREVRETAFYNYAVARMEGGKIPFGNSVALLEDFLTQFPDSRYAADVQRYIINGYMTDNDYESAIAAIDRVAKPSAAVSRARQRALFVLGTRDYSAGRYASAIDRLQKAAATADGDKSITTQCYIWLGDCAYSQGNYRNAVNFYNKFLGAAKSSEAYNRKLALYDLGYAEFASEQYAAALAAFRKAVAAKGTFTDRVLADAYSRMADCNYYLMHLDEAAAGYEKALNLNPESGDYALYQLAIMKGLKKDHAAKIAMLDRLPAEYPSSALLAPALLEKAESQMALHRTDDAVATYQTLVSTYPMTAQGRNGYLQLAITYMNSGRRDKATATYRKVITTYPSSDEAKIASDDLKKIYAADGNLSEFAEFIKSVPDAPAFDATEMEQLAFEAAENDYIDRSNTAKLKKFASDYPRSTYRPQALYYLADAAWNAGNAAEALAGATRVVEEYPHADVVEDALLIKGNAEAATSRTESALATFSELEKKASGANVLREARLGIMMAAMELGRYETVVATADKILKSTAAAAASDTDVRFMRGYALNELKQYDRAYADWKVLAANPAEINGAKAAYYMGQSQLDRGLKEDAESTADKLISSGTPHSYWLARGFILYSDVLRAKGSTFEADEYLRSLKSNYPGTEADIFQMINNRLKK